MARRGRSPGRTRRTSCISRGRTDVGPVTAPSLVPRKAEIPLGFLHPHLLLEPLHVFLVHLRPNLLKLEVGSYAFRAFHTTYLQLVLLGELPERLDIGPQLSPKRRRQTSADLEFVNAVTILSEKHEQVCPYIGSWTDGLQSGGSRG